MEKEGYTGATRGPLLLHMDNGVPNDSRRDFLALSLAGAGYLALPSASAAASNRSTDVIFDDRFNRTDGKSWGRMWFNQRYGRQWAIREGRSIFRLPATENAVDYRPNPVIVLDHDVRDLDLRITFSVSNAAGRAGVVGRVGTYTDYYAAYAGPSGLVKIVRCGWNREKTLARARIPFEANHRYRLRLKIGGKGPVNLSAKVWPAWMPEPATWTIATEDVSDAALIGAGAFGIYTQHATDGRGMVMRVGDVVARSHEQPTITVPSITYSLAGAVYDSGKRVNVVAKVPVPAKVGFQYGTDPTFNSNTFVVSEVETRNRSLTVHGELDLSILTDRSVVHWRAFAVRHGQTYYGPASSFRTGKDKLPVRFAFGACTKWGSQPHRSFEQARLKLVDLYLHQGDLGYPPYRVIAQAPDTYQDLWTRILADPHLQSLARESTFTFYRDDADYGRDRADSTTLRRFTIGAHGELNANPNNDYFEFRHGDIAFFCIDCRRYSTGKLKDPSGSSKLGATQTAWLKDRMTAARDDGAGLLVVASPQSFGSDSTPGAWRRGYQHEWSELIDFFSGLGAPVLIVSGDSHGHRLFEFPQKALPSTTPRIVEFLSAGTEQKKFYDELDPEYLLPDYSRKGSGFGLVEIGPEQEAGGEKVRTITLTAVKTEDGSTMWSRNYLAVRGVGILPVGL